MRAEPRSALPAPWRNPWGLLRQDLRAVAAWQRLRLQELWQRNREGDLWRPPFWPDALAAAFWPLVLVTLAAAVAVPLLLRPALPLAPLPAPVPAPKSGPPASAPAAAPQDPAEAPDSIAPPSPPTAPGESPPAGEAVLPPPPEPQGEPALDPAPDPLLEALEAGESETLVRKAIAAPAAALVQLELSGAFDRLPATQRQERAERWQERARRLGYDRLELRDPAGRSLGRSPRVGSGMILLDPVPLP